MIIATYIKTIDEKHCSESCIKMLTKGKCWMCNGHELEKDDIGYLRKETCIDMQKIAEFEIRTAKLELEDL